MEPTQKEKEEFSIIPSHYQNLGTDYFVKRCKLQLLFLLIHIIVEVEPFNQIIELVI